MSTHFGPMAGGLDMDMETGSPAEARTVAAAAQLRDRRNRRLEAHAALVADLVGDGGPVLRLIATKLVQRIETLIAGDTEASSYLSILRELRRDLQVGDRIVQEEMDAILLEGPVRE